eukprot:jgi/Mesvir1/17034/Mv16563-RA.1
MGFPSQYVDDLARTGRLADAAGAAAKKSSLAGSLAKNVGMSAVSFGVFAALGNLFGSDSSKVGAAQDTWTDDWTGTPEDATAAGLPGFGTAKKPKDEDGYSPLVSVIVFVAILALILAARQMGHGQTATRGEAGSGFKAVRRSDAEWDDVPQPVRVRERTLRGALEEETLSSLCGVSHVKSGWDHRVPGKLSSSRPKDTVHYK